MKKLEKIVKIVEENNILKNEIQQRLIKEEEDRKLQDIKKSFLLESQYVKTAEQIQFLITHISEALGKSI